MICPQTWLKATTHPNSVTQLKISLLTAWTTPIQETCSQPPSPDPRRNKESYTSLNGNTQTENNVPIPRFWYFFQYFHQLVKIYLNGPIINKNLGVRYGSKNLIDQERRKEQLTLSFHTSHLERAPWILLSPSLFFPVPLYSIISWPFKISMAKFQSDSYWLFPWFKVNFINILSITVRANILQETWIYTQCCDWNMKYQLTRIQRHSTFKTHTVNSVEMWLSVLSGPKAFSLNALCTSLTSVLTVPANMDFQGLTLFMSVRLGMMVLHKGWLSSHL